MKSRWLCKKKKKAWRSILASDELLFNECNSEIFRAI